MKLTPENAPWLKWPETRTLMQALAKEHIEVRFVGGAVRDSLLGREVKEVDLATSAPSEDVIEALERQQLRALPTGIRHGTITALVGARQFEITTLRKDVSCDGRHADVAFTEAWEEDAKRRDFTINALYADDGGEVEDYVGGLEHLKPLRLVFIGDAGERITEDALRMLRYFRFAAELQVSTLELEPLDAIAQHADKIKILSAERIAQETLRMLATPHLAEIIPQALQQTGLLPHLGLPPYGGVLARLQEAERSASIPPHPLTRLATWLAAQKKKTLPPWLLATKQREAMRDLFTMRDALAEAGDTATQKKLLRTYGVELYLQAAAMAAALGIISPSALQEMRALAQNWQIPEFPVKGEHILALGATPGPRIGEILLQLESAWEESDYKLTREQLLAQASKAGF